MRASSAMRQPREHTRESAKLPWASTFESPHQGLESASCPQRVARMVTPSVAMLDNSTPALSSCSGQLGLGKFASPLEAQPRKAASRRHKRASIENRPRLDRGASRTTLAPASSSSALTSGKLP